MMLNTKWTLALTLQQRQCSTIFTVPANSPKDYLALKMSAIERVHMLLILQKESSVYHHCLFAT
ncbi:hypothetical protein, partial [Yersinia pseudotuberculosis]|uniref:hypothetical protein n=1 Tax=Yersinia pseudotuberculosis TaxID=633 RepID=UPI001E55AEBF